MNGTLTTVNSAMAVFGGIIPSTAYSTLGDDASCASHAQATDHINPHAIRFTDSSYSLGGVRPFGALGSIGSGRFAGGSGGGSDDGDGPGSRDGWASRIPEILHGLALRQPITVSSVTFGPLSGNLNSPFVIASDDTKQSEVTNVLVSMMSDDGIVGHGEAAPFYGISGDTYDLLRIDLRRALLSFLSHHVTPLEFISLMRDTVRFPAARAALEMAFLDVHAKRNELSLFKFLSGEAKARELETDITIPIESAEKSALLAADYRDMGFERIKIKVGDDVFGAFERVAAIVGAFAERGMSDKVQILLDANEGYSADQAIGLLNLLERRLGKLPQIFEQPVRRDDLDGMLRVREHASHVGIMVFADESVFNFCDAVRVVNSGAADGINLKLMKHGGIVEALRIAELAYHSGLKLMVGGMVETKLAMSASLHLAQLIDPVWMDLDTPLLMDATQLTGGIIYEGARMILPKVPGIGVEPISEI